MKTFITFILSLATLFVTAQTDDYPAPDSATVVAFPWYNADPYLDDYANARGYYDPDIGTRARIACPGAEARYKIPVKMHIYRDDVGSAQSNITTANAEQVLAVAN